MKKRVLSLVLIFLVLFPVCGVISAAGATSQAPTARQIGKMSDDGVRTGTTGTKIIIVEPAGTEITAHVGDRMTIDVKLVRSDTGAGIPDAVIGVSVSLDGRTWTTDPRALVTDGNGEVGPITVIIPAPGSIPVVGSFVHLPTTGYVKVTYAGDGTYLGSETAVYKATLSP